MVPVGVVWRAMKLMWDAAVRIFIVSINGGKINE